METQKIVLFGAVTHEGQRILNEALDRGHYVTVIVTNPQKIKIIHPNLKVEAGDISNRNMTQSIKGHDVVISTYQVNKAPQEHLDSTLSLIDAVKTSGIKRLITLGHPGGNEVELAVPTPTTTEAWKAIAETQYEVLDTFENEKDIQWSYIHYPEIQEAVNKNNRPMIGPQMFVASSDGNHWFHGEKCAENVLNEIECVAEKQGGN
ncbi:MAG TPA: NAD(P)H-binding protein [Bacteroidia bacterium]|jgi:putative NADH-flavin reductase|nr:NAD(P)H-binding protein [Bacteroidia bacterium]